MIQLQTLDGKAAPITDNIIFEFNKDGTVTSTLNGKSSSRTYEFIDDNHIRAPDLFGGRVAPVFETGEVATAIPVDDAVEVSVSHDKLVLKPQSEKLIYIFERVN